MPKLNAENAAIYIVVVLVSVLIMLALYGWLSGGWEESGLNQ